MLGEQGRSRCLGLLVVRVSHQRIENFSLHNLTWFLTITEIPHVDHRILLSMKTLDNSLHSQVCPPTPAYIANTFHINEWSCWR